MVTGALHVTTLVAGGTADGLIGLGCFAIAAIVLIVIIRS